jgi:hypothetical protein
VHWTAKNERSPRSAPAPASSSRPRRSRPASSAVRRSTRVGSRPLAWAAIAAFAVLGIATLCVLWPDEQWEFEIIPNRLLSTYIERDDGIDVPIAVIHRDLALHMENSYLANETRRLRPLRWAFRIAVAALVIEVAIWLADLAVGA